MSNPTDNQRDEMDRLATFASASDEHADLRPGVVIGNFELQVKLGRGGMGEVWKAWDAKAERVVVLKLVPPELQHAGEEMARVKVTFHRVHALQHQHICPVYLLDEDRRFGWYLVMKYLDGQTLSAYRATYVARHGSFPLEQVIKVLRPVAEALDYAHEQKVIHRDVKPQNILVVGDAEDVQIVDFGLAAEIRTTAGRVSQQQMDTSGTRPYMAPEQWKGQPQDAHTDQYALAVVAYELICGRLPFESEDLEILRLCVLNDPPEAIVGQTTSLNRALTLGLAKRREERFATCREFVESLANLSTNGQQSMAAAPAGKREVIRGSNELPGSAQTQPREIQAASATPAVAESVVGAQSAESEDQGVRKRRTIRNLFFYFLMLLVAGACAVGGITNGSLSQFIAGGAAFLFLLMPAYFWWKGEMTWG